MSSLCALQLASRGERSSHVTWCFDCSSHHYVPQMGAGGLAWQKPSDTSVIWSSKLTQGNQHNDSSSGLRSESWFPPQKWVMVGSLPLPHDVWELFGLGILCKGILCGFCSRTSHTASSPKHWVDAVGCQKPICSCKAWFFLRLWFQTGLQALLLNYLWIMVLKSWLFLPGCWHKALFHGESWGWEWDAVLGMLWSCPMPMLLPHVHVPAHIHAPAFNLFSQILRCGWWNRLRQERNGGPMNETKFQQRSSNTCLAKVLFLIAPKSHWFSAKS